MMPNRQILKAKRRVPTKDSSDLEFHAHPIAKSSAEVYHYEKQDSMPENTWPKETDDADMPPFKVSREGSNNSSEETEYQHLLQFDESINKALESHDKEQIRTLLSSATTPDHLNRLGHKFLMCIFNHQLDKVKTLVEAGLPFEALDEANRIHYHVLAMDQGYSDIAAYLIEQGADVNVTRPGRVSLAHVACRRNDYTFLEKLIEYNCNIDVQCSVGFTPLMYACRYGSTECVQMLLANGISLNVTEKVFGKSALHLATEKKDPFQAKIIYLLLEAGSDPNKKDKNGVPPLAGLIENCESTWEAFEYLIPASKNCLNDKSGVKGGTVAHLAAENGRTNVLQLLKAHGADMALLDNQGQTVLHQAASSLCSSAIQFMIEVQCTSLNIQDKQGDTALHKLTSKIDNVHNINSEWIETIAPQLIKYGQDFNIQNKNGATPLITSLSKDYIVRLNSTLVETLIPLTNVFLKDITNQDALQHFIGQLQRDMSVISGEKIVKLFLAQGFDVASYFMQYGRNVFIYLPSKRRHECAIAILKSLIDVGIDVNLTENSQCALFTALRYSSKVHICLLLQANASFKCFTAQQHASVYSHNSHETELLKFIMLAGFDGRNIQTALLTSYPDLTTSKCQKKDVHQAVLEILEIINSVPSLVTQCCYKIRELIPSVKAEYKFNALPLPPSLIDKLKFKDIVSCLHLAENEVLLLEKFS